MLEGFSPKKFVKKQRNISFGETLISNVKELGFPVEFQAFIFDFSQRQTRLTAGEKRGTV